MSNTTTIQTNFLEGFKTSKEELTVFLLNGFQMKGTIVDYDDSVVNLYSQGKNHLIYKHAISTFTQEPSVVE
ncbi:MULTISPECIES: RNA chaperone Hfq [Staphylococcus]|uniref:RNA chaperone Hfq n=1 Tax=Staphylococcus TaxID=1279 RepID=UPI000D041710|nr:MULTISPECIES: RNA chaperone Hfq [Staphylococcus]MCD8914738.1 RNA chaperone Hfq [Staphylococcus simulans]UXV34045.1 RNA chaperone Hfq [Staphylococcus sp. IVB6181]